MTTSRGSRPPSIGRGLDPSTKERGRNDPPKGAVRSATIESIGAGGNNVGSLPTVSPNVQSADPEDQAEFGAQSSPRVGVRPGKTMFGDWQSKYQDANKLALEAKQREANRVSPVQGGGTLQPTAPGQLGFQGMGSGAQAWSDNYIDNVLGYSGTMMDSEMKSMLRGLSSAGGPGRLDYDPMKDGWPMTVGEALRGWQIAQDLPANRMSEYTFTSEEVEQLKVIYGQEAVAWIQPGDTIVHHAGRRLNPGDPKDVPLIQQYTKLKEFKQKALDQYDEFGALKQNFQLKAYDADLAMMQQQRNNEFTARQNEANRKHQAALVKIEQEMRGIQDRQTAQATAKLARDNAEHNHTLELDQINKEHDLAMNQMDEQFGQSKELIVRETEARKAIIDLEFEAELTLTDLRNELVREQGALDRAVRVGELEEAKRHSINIEILRAEEIQTDRDKQQLDFVMAISQNPAMLFYMKNAGLLSGAMGTSVMGQSLSGIVEELESAVPEGLRSNVQQRDAMSALEGQMDDFRAGMKRGLSTQSYADYIQGTAPYTAGERTRVDIGAPDQPGRYFSTGAPMISPFGEPGRGEIPEEQPITQWTETPYVSPRARIDTAQTQQGVQEPYYAYRPDEVQARQFAQERMSREEIEASEGLPGRTEADVSPGIPQRLSEQQPTWVRAERPTEQSQLLGLSPDELGELNVNEKRNLVALRAEEGGADVYNRVDYVPTWQQERSHEALGAAVRNIEDYLTRVWGTSSPAKAMSNAMMNEASKIKGITVVGQAQYLDEQIQVMIRNNGRWSQASTGIKFIHGKQYGRGSTSWAAAEAAFIDDIQRGRLEPRNVLTGE